MPTGTIGCEVLNIPDSTIEKAGYTLQCAEPAASGDEHRFRGYGAAAAGAAGRWRDHLLFTATPPFSRLNRSYFEQKLTAIFSEEYMEDAKAYLQLTQQEQLICALTGQHSKATMLVE